MIIRCHVCSADPCGRWKQPPEIIFIERHQPTDDPQYFCRDHVSPAKEEELRAREKALGWPPGGLR
jgi:hypothetical protein